MAYVSLIFGVHLGIFSVLALESVIEVIQSCNICCRVRPHSRVIFLQIRDLVGEHR